MMELFPKLMAAQGGPGLLRSLCLPFNYTIGLTFRCNSRCRTCRIYDKRSDELTTDEYEKIFRSWGRAPYWVTFSGGEPFLRRDIAQIGRLLYKYSRPEIINIPTNGILYKVIPGAVSELAAACPGSSLIINLSLDDIGERHDRIRGVRGNYEKALAAFAELKKLKSRHPNLTLGIHTVISRFNVERFEEIYGELSKLKPDSYVTEIAEKRVELGTMEEDISPRAEDYVRVIDFLMDKIRGRSFTGVARLAQALRLEYYRMVKEILLGRKRLIPCFAGTASVQIAPNGDVWPCCIKAEVMGNLRACGYDFKKLHRSKEAARLVRQIHRRDCYCPLANVAYTNMLCHLPTLFKAALHLAGKK